MMSNKNGLTLIEMLVAFAISSVVIMGAYALFKATTDIRISFKDKSENTTIQTSLTLLINRDLNAATEATPAANDYPFDKSISFVTHNSLFFNGAIPVTVTYLLENGSLFREELNETMEYKQRIQLISNVEKFEIFYFDGEKYTKNITNYKMIKIEVEIKQHTFNVIAGKLII